MDPDDPWYFGGTSSSEEDEESEERTPPGSPSPPRPPRQQLQELDPANLDTQVNETSDSNEEEKEDEGSSDIGSQVTTQLMTSEEEDVEEIERDAPPLICISDDEDPFNPAEAGPFETTEQGYTSGSSLLR